MKHKNYDFDKFVCLSKEAEEKFSELSESEINEAADCLAKCISQIIEKIESQYENN